MRITKPVRLSMSLHHLYFLLGRFQDLGIDVGPMNVRLDNIDSETPGNYVSFLSEFQRKKLMPSDAQSIHSMSSVKSVMSSVSALWNSLSSSSRHYDNIATDLQYLYSAFSKIPCLRLANDPKAKLIKGHEEYPFETATPIDVFHNLVVLEICEIDPKEVFGWDTLSGSIRYLVIKRAGLTDPADVLVRLVEDDAEKRTAGAPGGALGAGSADSAVFDEPADIMSLSALKRHRKSVSSPKIYPGPKIAGSSGSALSTSIPTVYYSSPQRMHRPAASVSAGSACSAGGAADGCGSIAAAGAGTVTGAGASAQAAATTEAAPQRRPYFYYPAPSRHRRSARSNSVLSDTSRKPALPDVAAEKSANANSSVSLPLSADGSLDFAEAEKCSMSQDPSCWRLLRHLSFTGNRISKLSGWCFENLADLSSLDLSFNRLTEIPTDALSKLSHLKSLNLSFNQLSSTRGMPDNMHKLAIVNLRGNKITDLKSLEQLAELEKIDLRQNRLARVADLKPLLLIDDERVRLKSIYMSGNPVSASRGYRIELFDLFNGVDYKIDVRIDGSRPGIFESRMLMDRKKARLNLCKFLDASIIDKMAAKVSSIGNKETVMKTKAETEVGERADAETRDAPSGKEPGKPLDVRKAHNGHLQSENAVSLHTNLQSTDRLEDGKSRNSIPTDTNKLGKTLQSQVLPLPQKHRHSSNQEKKHEVKYEKKQEKHEVKQEKHEVKQEKHETKHETKHELKREQLQNNEIMHEIRQKRTKDQHQHPYTIQVLAPNPNAINTSSSGSITPPEKPFSQRPAANRSSTLSSLLDKISISSSSEKKEPSENSRKTKSLNSSRGGSQCSNPVARISVTSPALPIITNTTTITTRSPVKAQSATSVAEMNA
ncbi:DEBR0S4_05534g1_1 [Brettanomyces bruxellensis]|uniref:DEBR0S4_05534g1_1 n=1 Tax=Dekkera bruxellensis TaxID=5007 RepID=A0A7D9CYU9_DEKBR|nr:DEBR0S4_05534g1_1 [Brettanomyces bruxellensis]